jgi:putative hydrolase of the HAD superfamily
MYQFLLKQYTCFEELASVTSNEFANAVLAHQKNGYEDKFVAYQLACDQLFSDPSKAEYLFEDFKDKYGFEAVLFDNVKEVLEKLALNFKLGIVTNGRERCQNAKIDFVGIRGLFKAIEVSEQFGIKKPDPRIFQSCLDKLGSKASDSICIGDNPKNDLYPAKELGMKTIWVKNNNFEVPEYVDAVIDTVAEIETALTQMT